MDKGVVKLNIELDSKYVIINVGRGRVQEINNRLGTDATYEVGSRRSFTLPLDMNFIEPNDLITRNAFALRKVKSHGIKPTLFVGRIIGYQIRTTLPKKVIGFRVAVGHDVGLMYLKSITPHKVWMHMTYAERKFWPTIFVGEALYVQIYEVGDDGPLYQHMEIPTLRWATYFIRLRRIFVMRYMLKYKRELAFTFNKWRGLRFVVRAKYMRRSRYLRKMQKDIRKLYKKLPSLVSKYVKFSNIYRNQYANYQVSKDSLSSHSDYPCEIV